MPIVSTENQSLLTAEVLRSVLNYDPETGIFTWKIRPAFRTKIGSVAGYQMTKGYWMIGVKGTYYVAHRLAWLYVNGKWPADQIDHINGVKSDNRIVNLRQATNSQNHANAPKRSHNTSGVKGVSWHKKRRRWIASIRVHGKLEHIGEFRELSVAADAYSEKARSVFGEFART